MIKCTRDIVRGQTDGPCAGLDMEARKTQAMSILSRDGFMPQAGGAGELGCAPKHGESKSL